MANSKAELELESRQHQAVMVEVRNLHQRGEVLLALNSAVSAWPFIDGMLQFERRYGDRAPTRAIDSIDFVLSYAPVTFDMDSLVELDRILRTQRRIVKAASTDLVQRLEDANSLMWNAYQMWALIDRKGEVPLSDLILDLGGAPQYWQELAQTWEYLGIVSRVPDRDAHVVRLTTRLDDPVSAMCSNCGVTKWTSREAYLGKCHCPGCGFHSQFVRTHPVT